MPQFYDRASSYKGVTCCALEALWELAKAYSITLIQWWRNSTMGK
eukprot:CAMPEP_0194237828 /NCGR_PEP_ID=MMETSP0158-20130606/4719_1 /TAXON_ID=33649 /ORGANISM="Thalassionema nitzschioides, Strain L26-B" /LENGTH=44 /DNA_ID= /DNA_START= /DNA_END= /DNA_ORIENTATION=